MKRIALFTLILVFSVCLSQSVSAATVHGTVYDLSLEKVANVKLTVDSVPAQTFISKDGSYLFELPAGEYVLIAGYYENKVLLSESEETVKIGSDGSYIVDLVLFPVLDEDADSIDEPEFQSATSNWYYYGLGVVGLILLFLIYLRYRKLKKRKSKLMLVPVAPRAVQVAQIAHPPAVSVERSTAHSAVISTDPELEKLFNAIKAHDGRVTQKELRKVVPYLSEAKVSLMIAELEHKGLIEKIKKGRGNLIWLKKS
jgi:uncharacterized membrane protein